MEAQYELGECCRMGIGTKMDSAEAVKWYRKAAERGLAKAQYWLGIGCSTGIGVEQNHAEALKW